MQLILVLVRVPIRLIRRRSRVVNNLQSCCAGARGTRGAGVKRAGLSPPLHALRLGPRLQRQLRELLQRADERRPTRPAGTTDGATASECVQKVVCLHSLRPALLLILIKYCITCKL